MNTIPDPIEKAILDAVETGEERAKDRKVLVSSLATITELRDRLAELDADQHVVLPFGLLKFVTDLAFEYVTRTLRDHDVVTEGKSK